MKFVLTLVLLLAPEILQAQTVFEISGGTSSLFQSSGAGLVGHFPNHTLTLGLGDSPSGVHFGFSDKFAWRGSEVTVGDRVFSFNQLSIVERGLAVEKHFSRNCTAKPARGLAGFTGCSHEKTLVMFVGSTGSSFNPLFFQSYRLNSGGAGIYFQELFSRGSLSTLESVHASKITALQSAEWAPSIFHFSANGGILENIPRFDAQAQLRPTSWMQLAVGHNEIQASSGRQTKFYKYDSAQAALLTKHFTVYGSAFEGQQRVSVFSGASIKIAGFENQVGYFQTTHEPRIVTDNISRRFRFIEVSGFYSNTQGHQTFGLGGGVHTNRFTVTVNHQILYNILIGSFQPTTTVNLSFRIRDITANLGALRDPTRKIHYTAYGNDFVQAGFVNTNAGQTVGLNKFLIEGKCVLPDGSPVEGCAVVVGKETVYSNSRGEFSIRMKKRNAVPVSVPVTDFAAPGEWRCLECPASTTPGESMTVIVERR